MVGTKKIDHLTPDPCCFYDKPIGFLIAMLDNLSGFFCVLLKYTNRST